MRRAAVCVLVCACLVSCGTTTEPPPPGVLRTASTDDVPTLDPAIGYDTASWFFEQMLFNTLLDYDDAGALVPELAERWTRAADGRTVVFHLRPDVRFSNGRRLIAADVKYSLERVLRPTTRSQGAEFFTTLEGAPDFIAGRAADVRGIEVQSDTAVLFHLAAHDPLFLHKLALQFAAVVPQEVAEAAGESFGSHPVGSGPFVLVEWRRGQRLRLRRNPDYFRRDQPALAGVEHLVGVNEQLEWLKWESGEIDISAIPASEFPSVIRDPRYRNHLVRETAMTTTYLGINCQVAPFDDLRVRRAVSYAINREKALRLINDRGEIAAGILPPGMPGHEVLAGAADFDPTAARALLREVGLDKGVATTLWTRTDETALRLAQSYQQDLADVGIAVRIKNLSWASYLEAIQTPKRVPLFMLAWQADFPDPSNFLEVLFHSRNIGSNNHSFFADPQVDALLDRAAAAVDPAGRLALLREAHAAIVSQRPWALLYYPVTYEAVSARVRGYRLHPIRPPRLELVQARGPEDLLPPERP